MVRWSINSVVLASTQEPISVDKAKLHCRVVLPDEDEWFNDRIIDARRHLERRTARQFMPATITATADGELPCGSLELPKPPLRAVTSVSYVDTAGVTQLWAGTNYQVSIPTGDTARRGRVGPVYAGTWPVTRAIRDAVTVVYTAGYANSDAVPGELKAAMLLLIGHWWMNREAAITGSSSQAVEYGVEALIAPYISRPEM